MQPPFGGFPCNDGRDLLPGIFPDKMAFESLKAPGAVAAESLEL
jgi:hypothetical protein